ncbi:GDSL-type esterase/lipase family protein [Paenibacillus eucommiae]|uniref:Lysophospholipase L1-like esterase n=1 Tax=Paenibacillus eucommiae TaxID=1355755 RepID=A0ABS4J4N5_9BACL|nr:GDSL-type esterase/lipase family protein [Paenibacillus eucommiae]MBP1994804.1 lysophospholipase L1-like esterase [Paenibacillus eucommiae]
MKTSRMTWGIVGVTASLATLLFVGGFIYASGQILFPSAASSDLIVTPSKQQPDQAVEVKNKLEIVALGDSLTAGTGDGAGKGGYVGRVREKLEKQTGKPVYVTNNLAIPGYRADQLLEDLSQTNTTDALADADVVVLTIGANDIFQGGEGIFSGDNWEEFNVKAAEERLEPTLGKVEQILTLIHKASPEAIIFYVGLYHPFLDLDPEREGSVVVQKWNDSVFQVTNRYSNMVLVPTYDLFERNLIKYLSPSDHFHPNQDGYERIADRIAQILK